MGRGGGAGRHSLWTLVLEELVVLGKVLALWPWTPFTSGRAEVPVSQDCGDSGSLRVHRVPGTWLQEGLVVSRRGVMGSSSNRAPLAPLWGLGDAWRAGLLEDVGGMTPPPSPRSRGPWERRSHMYRPLHWRVLGDPGVSREQLLTRTRPWGVQAFRPSPHT